MPTHHRRHTITETGDISNALEIARRTWPELADKPGTLLHQLILVGRDALAHDHAAAARKRQQAVGALAGVFGADYLKELREDWPE